MCHLSAIEFSNNRRIVITLEHFYQALEMGRRSRDDHRKNHYHRMPLSHDHETPLSHDHEMPLSHDQWN